MKINIKFIDHFSFKIIALVLMSLDHIAFFLIPSTTNVYLVLRIIGRLSFPIFCFMASNGALKSKKPLDYFAKFITLGIIMDVVSFLVTKQYVGNAFISLGLGVLFTYLLNLKNYYSFFSIIPLLIMFLSSFSFFPIRMDNGILSSLLFISFYLSKYLSELYIEKQGKQLNLTIEEIQKEKELSLQNKINLLSCVFCFTSYIILMFMDMYNFNRFPVNNVLSFKIESYGAISSFLFLFYNGKNGYYNKNLNRILFLYYPLHILVLYLISTLTH